MYTDLPNFRRSQPIPKWSKSLILMPARRSRHSRDWATGPLGIFLKEQIYSFLKELCNLRNKYNYCQHRSGYFLFFNWYRVSERDECVRVSTFKSDRHCVIRLRISACTTFCRIAPVTARRWGLPDRRILRQRLVPRYNLGTRILNENG